MVAGGIQDDDDDSDAAYNEDSDDPDMRQYDVYLDEAYQKPKFQRSSAVDEDDAPPVAAIAPDGTFVAGSGMSPNGTRAAGSGYHYSTYSTSQTAMRDDDEDDYASLYY